MQRTNIPAWSRGLVYKNNRYTRTLKEGKHWLWGNEKAVVFEMNKPFTTTHDINILMEDPALAEEIMVLEVREGEIVLQYEQGIFRKVVTPGSYAYWKGMINYDFIRADVTKIEITEAIERSVLVRPELAAYVRSFTVEAYEKALLYLDGKNTSLLEAGTYYFWKNPVVIQVVRVDTRQLQMEINGQEILTRDKAGIRINFQVQYRVSDIVQAVVENKEHEKQLYAILQLALREYVGGYSLDELLEKKDEIARLVQEAVKDKVGELGITVGACGIRDIILPGDMKDIMNQVLIAEKKAQANIITRREETASTRSLLNTAKLMEENEMLFRLKEMEYVEKISDKISNLSVSNGGLIIDQMKELFVPGSRKK